MKFVCEAVKLLSLEIPQLSRIYINLLNLNRDEDSLCGFLCDVATLPAISLTAPAS